MIGIDMQVIYQPPLGWGFTIGLLAVAMGVTVWGYVRIKRQAAWWQRGCLVMARLGALGILGYVLAGPSIEEQPVNQQYQAVQVVMLVDTSASMGERDVALATGSQQVISRWEAVRDRWLATRFLQQLAEATSDVRVYGFDHGLKRLSIEEAQGLEPTGKQTNLFGALDRFCGSGQQSSDGSRVTQINEGRPAVVVLLSDGHDTQLGQDPQVLSSLQRAGCPVMTVPVGVSKSVADIQVSAWAQADFVMQGQSTWVHAVVAHRGYDQQQVQVDLLEEGQVIQTQTLAFNGQASLPVRFQVTPQNQLEQGISLQTYRVVARLAPPAPLSSENNPLASRAKASGGASGGASGVEGGENGVEGGASGGGFGSEAEVENNQRWVFIQVSQKPIRVALFEGQPYWDTKYLAQVLGQDAQVELTAVYALGEHRTVTVHSRHDVMGDEGPGDTNQQFSVDQIDQAWLNRFDVVVLGHSVQRFFGGDRAKMLVDYVRVRGGSLVQARGRAFDLTTPQGQRAQALIEPIEPVRWGNQAIARPRLQVSKQALGHPLIGLDGLGLADTVLAQLPNLLAATRVQAEKSAAVVLLQLRESTAGHDAHNEPAKDNSMPALVYQQVGQGRVLTVASQGLWQWALLPNSARNLDWVYPLFWAKAIRWLATGGQFLPGQSVSLHLSPLAVKPGQPVQATIATRYLEHKSFEPQLKVTGPNGQVQAVGLARASEQSSKYAGTFTPHRPGVYRVELETMGGMASGQANSDWDLNIGHKRLAVYDRSAEKLDPSAQPALLASISQATGGQCWGLGETDRLLDYVRQTHQARVADPRYRYVFNQPWVFGAIAGLLGIEWIGRRRSGLV